MADTQIRIWTEDLVCLSLHSFTSLFVAGLLAIIGRAAMWDCLECGGNANFGLRDSDDSFS